MTMFNCYVKSPVPGDTGGYSVPWPQGQIAVAPWSVLARGDGQKPLRLLLPIAKDADQRRFDVQKPQASPGFQAADVRNFRGNSESFVRWLCTPKNAAGLDQTSCLSDDRHCVVTQISTIAKGSPIQYKNY